MDPNTIVRIVEAIATAVTAVVAWLAKGHAKDASASVGPKNSTDLQTLAHQIARNQAYQRKRNHDVLNALTATSLGVRLIADHLGITVPDPPKQEPTTTEEGK